MNKDNKSHLWIPDEEVQRLNKTLRAIPPQRNVSYTEHGSKLSHSLQEIKHTLDSVATDNSLGDSDLLVFNIELPEGEKIQDKQTLFDSNGMKVRAVKKCEKCYCHLYKHPISNSQKSSGRVYTEWERENLFRFH
ncbi:hypothetical protein [Cohnella rhizosphaerae]|uniref:Uncharacterized protein n=1 Tax=Cohnella rhizosphaerae TaxID=1457232 RepID=A0A9X4KSZ5_9BACL|nr:hypothetical protein [Cohnella rhizosphaerae]MDG0810290.1 hypothetical protein [Cohnella rhizosphaerae]